MNMQQWNKHKRHFEEDINWPATKQEMIDACEGEHYEPEVLKELKTILTDGDKKYTKEEFKNIVMSQKQA